MLLKHIVQNPQEISYFKTKTTLLVQDKINTLPGNTAKVIENLIIAPETNRESMKDSLAYSSLQKEIILIQELNLNQMIEGMRKGPFWKGWDETQLC